jgi:hypothetical protein
MLQFHDDFISVASHFTDWAVLYSSMGSFWSDTKNSAVFDFFCNDEQVYIWDEETYEVDSATLHG